MSDKAGPFDILTTPATLTGTLTALGGDATTKAVRLYDLASVTVWADYVRAGGSVTGRPIIAVELSRDAPDTAAASVAHWSRVPIADGSSFSSGAMETYPESLRAGPTATGATTHHWPGIDTRGAHWIRVLVADVDAVAPGTVALYLTGAL